MGWAKCPKQRMGAAYCSNQTWSLGEDGQPREKPPSHRSLGHYDDGRGLIYLSQSHYFHMLAKPWFARVQDEHRSNCVKANQGLQQGASTGGWHQSKSPPLAKQHRAWPGRVTG